MTFRDDIHLTPSFRTTSVRMPPFWTLLQLRIMDVVMTPIWAIRRAKTQWNWHH